MPNIAANGTEPDHKVKAGFNVGIAVSGTWDGGTLTISHKTGTQTVIEVAKTANFSVSFLALGTAVSLVLAGATSPDLDYMITQERKIR